MWVPLKEKEKNQNQKVIKIKREDGNGEVEEREKVFFLNFPLSFFLRFTKIRPSEFVGINTKSALHDEGYAWVPKIRDFTENSGKYSENPKFLVFLISTVF